MFDRCERYETAARNQKDEVTMGAYEIGFETFTKFMEWMGRAMPLRPEPEPIDEDVELEALLAEYGL